MIVPTLEEVHINMHSALLSVGEYSHKSKKIGNWVFFVVNMRGKIKSTE